MKGKLKDLVERANSSENHDTSVNGASRDFGGEAEALAAFRKFERKLFDLPAWNVESALSSFALFDENGAAVERPLAENDFIRISLKGSGKYDWVRVAAVDRGPDEIILTVKPTFDPTGQTPDKESTSHFFTSEASNNFCLQKDGDALLFYVVGLSEKTNLGETESALETVRNAAVANLGYFFGVQKAEWNIFCRNFLELGEEE